MNLSYFRYRLNEDRASSNSSGTKDANITPEEIAKKFGVDTERVNSAILAGREFEMSVNEIEDLKEATKIAILNITKDLDFYSKSASAEEE